MGIMQNLQDLLSIVWEKTQVKVNVTDRLKLAGCSSLHRLGTNLYVTQKLGQRVQKNLKQKKPQPKMECSTSGAE